ncbi:MAG: FkbM family methyltransferase [Flammeovirgaceae bacterium]
MNTKEAIVINLKKMFRGLYYFFKEGSVTTIKSPEILKGYKWVESREYGLSYSQGYYEKDLLQCLSRFLNKDSVFFDVGSHAGYVSLYGSRIASKVYSFEPETTNFLFSNNIVSLNLIDNILITQKAVGSKSGKMFFQEGTTSSTGKISSVGSIPIDIVSIDEFILTNRIQKLDLIKIDVEGFGAEVIKGMTEAIRNFRPIIFFELHNDDELKAIKNLEKAGYKLYTTELTIASLNSLPNQFLIALPTSIDSYNA